jgi:3-carboxy-cis,cis-muconate cycloisomerase
MPRPEAEVAVKRLCVKALATGTDLRALAARDWPGLVVPLALGAAPAEAQAFAATARARQVPDGCQT